MAIRRSSTSAFLREDVASLPGPEADRPASTWLCSALNARAIGLARRASMTARSGGGHMAVSTVAGFEPDSAFPRAGCS